MGRPGGPGRDVAGVAVTWLIDKSALVRLSASPDGHLARSGTELRTGLRQPPLSAMPVQYLTPAIEDRAVEVLTCWRIAGGTGRGAGGFAILGCRTPRAGEDYDMGKLDTIRARRKVRPDTPQPLAPDKLEALFLGGRRGPTNGQ